MLAIRGIPFMKTLVFLNFPLYSTLQGAFFCSQMVSGYGVPPIWPFLCLFQIFVKCLLVVVLVTLISVLAGHMKRLVCSIEALFYQFQCSTHRYLGSVG